LRLIGGCSRWTFPDVFAKKICKKLIIYKHYAKIYNKKRLCFFYQRCNLQSLCEKERSAHCEEKSDEITVLQK
jgi:hypothetical protein